ncbi:EAL domain-containing protein [Clostridium sp. BL-8]|uniref:EAL domain-containing protein n=1 Tax=Clostridium sp. BL-8 TaxID=349938 RepID=UPI00098BF070|nr:EAL domain-containing protein [Clostridium sp. BL-8]OOM81347.1 cyclic di-GMP phosphodiesterase Gmr [Clostridium sp. BL-8]
MKVSFRIKLFIFCVVIILFTSIPIAIITRNYMINSLKEDFVSDGKEQVEGLDNNILSLINNMKENAKILADDKDIKKADESVSALFNIKDVDVNKKYSGQMQGLESDIYSKLELYARTHGETQYACFGTKWGGYIQWPDGLGNGKFDPRKRPWYSLALEHPDEVVISDPYEVEIDKSNNIIISACTTVRNDSGDIVGVISIDTSLNKLSDIIRNTKSINNGYYFLYLKDGTILANPNSDLNFKNIKDLEEKNSESSTTNNFEFSDTSKFINTENGSFDAAVNGSDSLVNIYTSPYTGWKLATVIPKNEFMTEVRNVENMIIKITICILILGIVLTYFVIRTITSPIKKLTTLMKTVEEGELLVKATIETNDEFGALGGSFNLMMERLNSNYEELSALYEELVATEEELRTQYEELQHNEDALRNSEERYKLALECANDSIWEVNLDTGEFFCSDKLTDIIGDEWKVYKYSKDFTYNLVHPKDLDRLENEINKHINNETKSIEIEYRLKRNDGYYVWALCKGKAIRNSENKVLKLAGSISDISKKKLSEEKLEFMAYYDTLTRLPNKALLIKKLNKQFKISKKEQTSGAVFFIDLDDFKNINDLMGHKYGDEVLVYLSRYLQKIMREKDIVCKFSGDEFMIISPLIEESEVEDYANKMLALFNQSFNIDNTQTLVTASIGIALYPKDGMDTDTIIKNSSLAMYKAKEMGKNRYALYNHEIYLRLERINKINNILRSAIINNEFSVNYQPQYDTVKNEVFGFEALIRLNSRELGFISPVEFIPIAEKYGYITEITLWVLREACKQSVKLFENGYNFKSMSINISSVDLQQAGFLEKVVEIIEETGVETKFIELEITETVLMKSIDSSIDILKKFMDMGIRIALDDFGTGYSSLAYLRKIPISTLKIDKSFIDDIHSSNVEKSIINSVIRMAHAMDLKVVAEGVENREQFLILKDKSCDYIQGYYFSKPLPASKIEEIFI